MSQYTKKNENIEQIKKKQLILMIYSIPCIRNRCFFSTLFYFYAQIVYVHVQNGSYVQLSSCLTFSPIATHTSKGLPFISQILSRLQIPNFSGHPLLRASNGRSWYFVLYVFRKYLKIKSCIGKKKYQQPFGSGFQL